MTNRETIKKQILFCEQKIRNWDSKANAANGSERTGLSTSQRQDWVDDLIRLKSKLSSSSKRNS